MSRLEGAIRAVMDAIVTVAEWPGATSGISQDDDLVDDLSLDELELEGFQLILEEVFSIEIPDEIWTTPLYRTPASLAEWIIRHSESASYAEAQRQRRSV